MIKSQTSTVKLIMLGPAAVGKTSLVNKFVSGDFKEQQAATIGGCFASKQITVPNSSYKKLNFQIWDIAGSENYFSMAKLYYQDSAAAVLTYDITSLASFKELAKWKEDLDANAPKGIIMVVCANKVDLPEGKWQVNFQDGVDYAKSIGAIFKNTSAKEGLGVEELFIEVGERLFTNKYKKQLEEQKETPGHRITPIKSNKVKDTFIIHKKLNRNNQKRNGVKCCKS